MYAQNGELKAFSIPWRTVWSHLMLGKSLTRTALNWWVRNQVNACGKVCDVGGGAHPSYAQFVDNRFGWIIVDIDSRVKPSVVALLQALPFQSGTFDSLICFNVLEHIYEARTAATEMSRVLKTGGRLFLFVPFLVNVHPDPHDYHRYTADALENLLTEAGFTRIRITVFFGLCSSLLNLGMVLIPIHVVRALLGLGAMLADRLVYRVKPDLARKYVIAYGVEAERIPA